MAVGDEANSGTSGDGAAALAERDAKIAELTASNAELTASNAELTAKVEALTKQVELLTELLNRNSKTSDAFNTPRCCHRALVRRSNARSDSRSDNTSHQRRSARDLCEVVIAFAE